MPQESRSCCQVYCPLCEDCYCPRSKYHDNIDGAFFGTTFPHMLLMTYPQLRPTAPAEPYVPRVFGFRLHHSALGRPLPLHGPEGRVSLMVSLSPPARLSHLPPISCSFT